MATFREDIIAFIKATATTPPIDNANACGKFRHLTAEDARRHLRQQRSVEHKSHGRRLEVYECRTCGYFHIGHNPFLGRYRKFLKESERVAVAKMHPKV